MKKCLITGIAGTGKSTICAVLRQRGYETYDIEDIPNMFAMFRKDTGQLYEGFNNADPQKIKNSEWLCDISKLEDLLQKQKQSLAYYCGVASNMDDLIPHFDQVILLVASSENVHQRLSTREGTNDMGNTESSRQTVLGWKDWWENEMRKHNVLEIDANQSTQKIADIITEQTKG